MARTRYARNTPALRDRERGISAPRAGRVLSAMNGEYAILARMSRAADSPRTFTVARSVAYSSLLVLLFFGIVEGGLRLVGVAPPLSPRILLKRIDTDIGLPFMQPDPDLFWSPIPGFVGSFDGKPVTINSLGLRG